MIPRSIRRSHIEAALPRIRREGAPPQRRSRGYCLVEGGVHFPPKVVISLAHDVAEGKPLASNAFHGGAQSNRFLEERGFEVVACGCGGASARPREGVVPPRPRRRSRISPPPGRSKRSLVALIGRQAPRRRSDRMPHATPDRLAATQRFYQLLNRLAARTGGPRRLEECRGRMGWPSRGAYFFFEPGEERSRSGAGPRVVRVGTHALAARTRSTLWGRLRSHRGTRSPPGGRHRSSIFRGLVGEALALRDGARLPPSWRRPGTSTAEGKAWLRDPEVRRAERILEERVSKTIGAMPFLWLDVTDEPGPGSDRGRIERNAIALLSGYRAPAPDPPSDGWLGLSSGRPRVRRSGLWNQNHVGEAFAPGFLDAMAAMIR